MTTQWKFYGRKKEIQTLEKFVNHRNGFSSLAIYGRRNVGKTALFRHFTTIPERNHDSRKIIRCALTPSKGSCHRFVTNLQSAIMKADSSLLDDYIAHENENFDVVKLARHILENGHILMIDEFQRIRLDGDPILEGLFQELIDDLRIPGPVWPDNWNPRLIVMGSEQQRLIEMFKHPRAPMFNRITDYLQMTPWAFSEFKEMVLDQGWDSHPNRLLTLWTAYNGLPRHWERFQNNSDLSDFSRIPDDSAWTREFMKREEHRRTSPGEGFQDQMEVQLRSSDLAIIRWLAEKPSGRNLATDLTAAASRPAVHAIRKALQKEHPDTDVSDAETVRTLIEEAIDRRLSDAHLGLLRARAPLDSESRIKWSVNDNFARFQLQGLEPFAPRIRADERAHQVLATERVSALQHLEGYGLEQFAARALYHFFAIGTDVLPANAAGRTELYTRLERTDVSGDLDIVLIHHKEHPTSAKNYDGLRDFWIGSAKRFAKAFGATKIRPEDSSMTSLWRDITRIRSFLAPLSGGDVLTQTHFFREWRGRVNYVVIARTFTEAEKSQLAQVISDMFAVHPEHGIDDVYSMDIADIMSGRGPQLLPLPEPCTKHAQDTLFKEQNEDVLTLPEPRPFETTDPFKMS